MSDKFLILACDGVWDVLEPQQAVDVVTDALREHEADPQKACEVLVQTAFDRGSTDNITGIIVTFDAGTVPEGVEEVASPE